MRRLVIQMKSTEKAGMVFEDNDLCEYMLEKPGIENRPGSIFVGKIIKIHDGMQAAFVDIGLKRDAFLKKEAAFHSSLPLKQLVKEGELLFVQMIKGPVGNKGAQVTTDIAIPGLYSVFQPFESTVSVSKKLEQKRVKELKDEMASVFEGQEGCIIRTAAAHVSVQVVKQEIVKLKNEWERMKQKISTKPGLLKVNDILPMQWIRKFPIHTIDEIVIDDPQASRELKKEHPSISEKIVWRKNFGGRSVNEWQDLLTNPVITLENGIELVIEVTEAMTVIDVNSHKYKDKSMSHAQKLEINKQAGREIQKQLRLRNISGIIVVDFISMNHKGSEKHLEEFMKKQVKRDSVPVTVYGMTRLGLMELTRKREWPSILKSLSTEKTTPYTREALVYRLERLLLSYSETNVEAVLLAVQPDLLDLKKQLISGAISSKIPQELFVRRESSISDFQIELEGSVSLVRDVIQQRGIHVDNLF